MKKEKKVLALYLILVMSISIPIEAIWIYFGQAVSSLGPILMLIPAIIAIILKLIFYRKQSLLGLRIGKLIYYIFAIVIPLAYIGLSYLLYWVFVPGTFIGPETFMETISTALHIQNRPVAVVVISIITILGNIPVTFGEEVGWRGLMYPMMDKLWGRNKALLVSGVIWALWHLPVLVGGVYMAGAKLFYAIPMFIISFLAITVIVSWLRMNSNSVWPAVLWHIMHNFLDQFVFKSMTGGANRAYFVSETGFITTLFSVLFAVLILVFGKFKTECGGIGDIK